MKNLLFLFFFVSLSGFSQNVYSVYFETDSAVLDSVELNKMKDWVHINQNIEIVKILGYCDSTATVNHNLKLSAYRADYVKNQLFQLNKSFQKPIVSDGMGELSNVSDLKQNRRVDIHFLNSPEKESLSEKFNELKKGEKLRLDNLYFLNNSGEVVPESIPILNELLQVMQKNPKLKIRIEGHICCQPVGDVGDISTLRSKSVYGFLVENGIEANRLDFIGYGSKKPLYRIPEKNDYERNQNRRVEIEILSNE